MTRPYTPLPWKLNPTQSCIVALRDGMPVTVASGILVSDARYIVHAANLNHGLIDAALRIRAHLVQLSHDNVAQLRLRLITLFNTLLIKTIGDQT